MSCAWQQEKFLCQFDGIPAYMEQAWSYGASALDVALYDRVDVVRGATGLLTGSGNPSASINLVRKHAVSRDFTGTVSVGGGDFNKTRGVADVTVPLRTGRHRARTCGGRVSGRRIGHGALQPAQEDRLSHRRFFDARGDWHRAQTSCERCVCFLCA